MVILSKVLISILIRKQKECSEVTTFCSQLKMLASDGKIRLRDVLDTK